MAVSKKNTQIWLGATGEQHTEHGVGLGVSLAGVDTEQRSKVVVRNLSTVVTVDERAPLLLHLGGLEILVLVQNVNAGNVGTESRHEIDIDLIVNPIML